MTIIARANQLEVAQRLRYRIFYQEMGAVPTSAEREADAFDQVADHLVVVDVERRRRRGPVWWPATAPALRCSSSGAASPTISTSTRSG